MDTSLEDGVPYTERLIRKLEVGQVVTVITSKRKPERLTLKVILETKEMICIRTPQARPEITISLQQVQEFRTGKKSCDFDKSEEVYKLDSKLCLVILYGNTFNLKTFSFSAPNQDTFEAFWKGLNFLLDGLKKSSYLESKDRWFWKQFHNSMASEAYAAYCSLEMEEPLPVKLKSVKGWLARIKCDVDLVKSYIKKLGLKEELSYRDFDLLLSELLCPAELIDIHFKKYFITHSPENRNIDFENFSKFLTSEQKMPSDLEQARNVMNDFLKDPTRCTTLYFSEKEFVDYLFSPENEIYTSEVVDDDMNQSLSNYWIASSHNTYLTGDQLKSESSVEPYARCLRSGCRCVELDCWDGPDNNPIIYHGKTLTTKIKLVEVLHVIKDNAFYSSQFPVILSMENHCGVTQQKVMAKLFEDIFQDQLLTEPIKTDDGLLPTPNQLLNKIIIKDKKLKDKDGPIGSNDIYDSRNNDSFIAKDVISIKLFQDKNWSLHDCVLTDKEVIITPYKEEEEDEEEDIYDFPYQEIYTGDDDDISIQVWYHGLLEEEGSRTAEDLIKNFQNKQDGVFLVRDNTNNGYTVSFWYKSRYGHCRISLQEGKYCLNRAIAKDTIVELVEYYETNPLQLKNGESILLKTPIPVKPDFLNAKWYHNIDRCVAENLLSQCKDGTFLIRPSSIDGCYSLSVIYHNTIRHYVIKRQKKLFLLGNYSFINLYNLVSFFHQRSISKNIKLIEAATKEMLEQQQGNEDAFIYDIYSPVGVTCKMVTVRALYDFTGADETQLTFRRGEVITEVKQEDSSWWTGNYGDSIDKLFPANYVELIEDDNDTEDSKEPIVLKLENCVLEERPVTSTGYVFKVYNSSEEYMFNFSDQKDFVKWSTHLSQSMKLIRVSHKQKKVHEQEQGLAVELSKLIIYCQAVKFRENNFGTKIVEMSSFSENVMLKNYLNKEKIGIIIRYNEKQLSRVYPPGTHLMSTNYDPIPIWSAGCHMVALNYQTSDKFQQINQALFRRNCRCGYVLKPSCISEPNYSPFDLLSMRPKTLALSILGGRNVYGGKTNVAGYPFVCIEIIGLPPDKQKVRTTTREKGTNFSPVWENQLFRFEVKFWELAFLRFEVLDESFKTVYSQATYPLKDLREGYRCVSLQNKYSERLELSSLLVLVKIKHPYPDRKKKASLQ